MGFYRRIQANDGDFFNWLCVNNVLQAKLRLFEANI